MSECNFKPENIKEKYWSVYCIDPQISAFTEQLTNIVHTLRIENKQ